MFHNSYKKLFFFSVSLFLILSSCSSIPKDGQDKIGLLILAIEEEGNYAFPETKWIFTVINSQTNEQVYKVTTPVKDRTIIFQLPEGKYYIQNQVSTSGRISVEKIAFYNQSVESGKIYLYPYKYYVDAEDKGTSVVYHSWGWRSLKSDETSSIEESLKEFENFVFWNWVGMDEEK